MAKLRRTPATRSGRSPRRPRKQQIVEQARTSQQIQRRQGRITATDDESGTITLHAEVGGKTKGRVLEVHQPDAASGAVPVDEQIEAFVRRLPPAKAPSKRKPK